MKKGLLLINLGTPNAADKSSVRQFLREFLSDRRVIDLPAIIRYSLLYGLILPFRTKKSTHAYQSIWQQAGSPLLIHSQALCDQLLHRLNKTYQIALGMRYGQPSIANAIKQLKTCDHVTILPLYPQYSSAATGSSIEKTLSIFASQTVLPSLHIVRDFYQNPYFIEAQAAQIQPYINNHEHILFSYHGLPESHLKKVGCKTICTEICPNPADSANSACYRAQCLRTSTLLAEKLQLSTDHYSSAFQSRLGKTPWIKPYTDDSLQVLAARGIKRLAITCPSFVADCLETLEEIGMQATAQWQSLGGEQCTLIPCLNSNEQWVDAIIKLIDSPYAT